MEEYSYILELMKENRDLPKKLIVYTEKVLKKQNEGRYIKCLIENPSIVINNISRLIQLSAEAIQLPSEELFQQSGFDCNDLDPSKIEAFFAELRAVNYLNNEGFNNIHFIKKNKYKTADLYAERNRLKYVIEVTCSSSYAKMNRWRQDEIVDFCKNKLLEDNKLEQLKVTCYREFCNKMVFALVIDTEDKIALNNSEDFRRISREVWEGLEKVDDLHICIITGRETLGFGIDDIVYPPWL